MMKFLVAVVFFSFQITFSMDLVQYRQRSLSVDDEATEKKSLKLPIQQLAKRPQVNLALLTFDQLKEWFKARPVGCQNTAKKLLSPHMLVLYEVAMLVEDVRKYTVFWMFGARKENEWAVEEFCKKPIVEALQLYHEVRNGLGNSDKPMGPLYTMSQLKRDFVLQALNPWYYSYPFTPIAMQEQIDDIDEAMKLYLDDITINPLPYGIEEDYKVCTLVSCGMPRMTEETIIGGGLMCGATCQQSSPLCICKMPLLNILFRMSGCVGVSLGSLLCSSLCCRALIHSQKKTL